MADPLKKYFPEDDEGKPVMLFQYAKSQNVDGTSASAQSAAINAYFVRIASTDNALRVAIGSNPTAAATSLYIPAGQVEVLPITPGQKVAVLGGIANIAAAGFYGSATTTTTTTTTPAATTT